MKNLCRLKIHNIKKSRSLPSNLFPWLFLLAAVVGLLSTAPMRERRDDFWIRRRFEQALAAFDGKETEFTITYETDCGHVAFYQRSSDQLTPKQRQAVQNYIHTLRHYFRPYHQRDGEPRYPIGGASITVAYSLHSGETIQAGSVCWLETSNGRQVGRSFYDSPFYWKKMSEIFTTRYREELLNSAEFST